MIKDLRRLVFCKMNHHYHPETDGFYLAGVSHGRCHACGAFIKKHKDRVWRKATK